MARFFKWLAIAVGAFVIIVVALVAALLILVDPNDYRDDISRLVKENTGQELVIEGDIRLSFFPWLGLDLGRTRLENREGFGEQPFVQIERAGVAVELFPLLRREVVLDVVRLDGLLVHLVVNEQGEANWELDLPDTGEEIVDEVPREPGEPPAERAVPPVRIGKLGGVELTRMQLIYEDRREPSRQELGPVNVYVGPLALGEDVPVDADWVATLDDSTRMEGGLSLKARINEELNRVLVDLGRLEVEVFADGLPDSGVRARLNAQIDVDLDADAAQVRDAVVEVAGLRVEALADVAALSGAPRVNGRFEIPETDLRRVLARLEQELPDMADDTALTRFSAGAGFAFAGDRVSLEDLVLRLDDTTFTGGLSVQDFDRPMIGFNLEGDRLDADRYLPPPEEEEPAAEAPPPGNGEAEPVEIPVELIRDLRLDGSFRLAELVVMELLMEDVHFTVKADGGQLRVHPVGADLYGGQYRGDIRVDAREDEAVISVDERVTGVQARQIVEQLMGNDLLHGTGDVHINATARGRELDAVLRTLAGQAEFRFADGAVQGLNVAQMIRTGAARLQGQSVPAEPETRETDFTELTGTLVFDGGRVRNDDLQAQSPLFRINGAGEVDLLKQTVDYRLLVSLVGTLEGQGGQSLDNLRRLPIPLRFRGDLMSPSISLDLQAALTEQQRQRLREEEEALRQRAREEEEAARERLRREEERARERVEEERERVEDEVRDRARDELRRLLR
ncbi:MAG: AsmA family protein [Ectothiorhodospiraceae bacterium]|nr:AsmA family protein [Ectothiorhodospiraceae bacterium]